MTFTLRTIFYNIFRNKITLTQKNVSKAIDYIESLENRIKELEEYNAKNMKIMQLKLLNNKQTLE